MYFEEGDGWSRQLADRIEVQYKQFLKLTFMSADPVVPTKLIDTFWHTHTFWIPESTLRIVK